MSPEYLKEPPKVLTDFEKAMKDLLGDHAEDLELLKDIPNIQHALVQHEVKRLDRKLGRDHPRVKNLRSSLAHNADVVRSFSPDVEKEPEEEPDVGSDDSIIMGRLVDEKNIAMVGMTVDIEDESGRKIPNIGGVKTDDAGNFILRIDPQNAEKVKNQVGGTGYVTVRDHTGKVVHQDAAPLRPDKGGQMSMNVSVSTEKFSGKEQVLKPRGPIPRPPMDAGIRKVSPGIAALDGKGNEVTTGKGAEPFDAMGMVREQPAIFTPSMGEESLKPAEFKPMGTSEKGTMATISKAPDMRDEVIPKGMGREEPIGREKETSKGPIGMGGERMDEDEGEEIVAARGMAGKGSSWEAPPDVPPGPGPEDLAKKPEKQGFFRKSKESLPQEEVVRGKIEEDGKKKLSRKERKLMEK